MLGFTFKENCPDIRNTKIIDIYHTLQEYTDNITVYEPWADPDKVFKEYGIHIVPDNLEKLKGCYDTVILAVAHNDFKEIKAREFLNKAEGVVYDVKGVLPLEMIDGRL